MTVDPARGPFAVADETQRAMAIRAHVLAVANLDLADILSRRQAAPLVKARAEVAYRTWTECPSLSANAVARIVGRADHSSAIPLILAGAEAAGRPAARISDLRGAASDPVDWPKLAYAAAGWRTTAKMTLSVAADRAGLSRAEWRKIENGRSVSAGTLLLVCRLIGLDPASLVSRETAVEHGGAT